MPRPSFSRHFSRSKPPTKRDAERRALTVLTNTRDLRCIPPETLARTTGLTLVKAKALWDAERGRRSNG